jgi:hypothetical protein
MNLAPKHLETSLVDLEPREIELAGKFLSFSIERRTEALNSLLISDVISRERRYRHNKD